MFIKGERKGKLPKKCDCMCALPYYTYSIIMILEQKKKDNLDIRKKNGTWEKTTLRLL